MQGEYAYNAALLYLFRHSMGTQSSLLSAHSEGISRIQYKRQNTMVYIADADGNCLFRSAAHIFLCWLKDKNSRLTNASQRNPSAYETFFAIAPILATQMTHCHHGRFENIRSVDDLLSALETNYSNDPVQQEYFVALMFRAFYQYKIKSSSDSSIRMLDIVKEVFSSSCNGSVAQERNWGDATLFYHHLVEMGIALRLLHTPVQISENYKIQTQQLITAQRFCDSLQKDYAYIPTYWNKSKSGAQSIDPSGQGDQLIPMDIWLEYMPDTPYLSGAIRGYNPHHYNASLPEEGQLSVHTQQIIKQTGNRPKYAPLEMHEEFNTTPRSRHMKYTRSFLSEASPNVTKVIERAKNTFV